MSIYEELLADTIDLHCHIDREFAEGAFRKREPEAEWLPKAEALHMRGVVLKSHWWPTAVAVPYIRELYQGPVQLWSSIVLNPIAGGPELWAVESAAAGASQGLGGDPPRAGVRKLAEVWPRRASSSCTRSGRTAFSACSAAFSRRSGATCSRSAARSGAGTVAHRSGARGNVVSIRPRL